MHNSGTSRREIVDLHPAVVARESGRSSIPGASVSEVERLRRTGCPAFAGHDSSPKLKHPGRFAIRTTSAVEKLFRRLCSPRPKHARRRREAAGGAVGHLDLILPRQPEGAGDHVLHEGVGGIHRAAFHRDVSAMPDLIDIVLDAPVNPRLAHQIGAHFGGDDLVHPSGRAVRDDHAIEIDDHAFAHRIVRNIRPATAYIVGDPPNLETFILAWYTPAVAHLT